jgi:CheY-like chemotaxis protein
MRIFLLDDSIKRLQRFRRFFQEHAITHSASAAEAMMILAREQFDLICLDHDLTEHDNDWIADGTGYEVAHFLGNHATPNDEALIIIHTMNPAGGERMMLALKNRRVQRISIIELLRPEAMPILLIELSQK